MFGGQDNTATMPQTGGGSTTQADSLQGVADLVGGTTPTASALPSASSAQSGTFMPQPSDSQATSAPALPEEPARGGALDLTSTTGSNDDLLGIKQQALQQLTPLVSHLDQTPLERFRTTMMLIQASDNQALLKDAYEAAQKIEDDKTRAQALLDVINEINYFTQPKQDSPTA